jgi:probable HAF family extracellular repeat protein
VKVFVKRALAAGATALSLLSSAGGAQAAVYRLTDLGDLGGGGVRSRAYDINNLGQVVGFSSGGTGTSASLASMRAFVWDSVNGMQPLGLVSNRTSFAYGINEAGQITGEYWMAGTPESAQGYRADARSLQNLGSISGGTFPQSARLGINESGAVAGEMPSNAGSTRGFVWGAGGAETLQVLPGQTFSAATDINDSGLVVGHSGPAANELGTHAFSYNGTTMTDLGDLTGGGNFSAAHGVNNNGWIVGQSAEVGGRHAFLWDGQTMTSLGNFGSAQGASAAYDINASGQIVGFGTTDARSAFVWAAGTGMMDLNELIDRNDPMFVSGFRLLEAHAINDLGQIVGFGTLNGSEHAFLLTPVPEPHQYGMMLAGLGMVGWMVKRRRSAAPSMALGAV